MKKVSPERLRVVPPDFLNILEMAKLLKRGTDILLPGVKEGVSAGGKWVWL